MDDEVEPAPIAVERVEDGVDARDILDVAGQDEVRAERLRERRDTLAERLALVGEGELGAMRAQDLGDAPGDRVVVGDAHDEAALALHQAHGADPPALVRPNLERHQAVILAHVHDGAPKSLEQGGSRAAAHYRFSA